MNETPSNNSLRKQNPRSQVKKPLRASDFDNCLRAEREDDDGYHPYADRSHQKPLFEPDPWD